MDRVTVLSRSSHTDRSDYPIATVQSVLTSAFANVIHIQRALSALTISLILHAWFVARMALWAGRLFILQAWSAGVSLSGKVAAMTWSRTQLKGLRKRIERDFACFILGSGYGIFLMLFWPGWWIVLGAALVISRLCG